MSDGGFRPGLRQLILVRFREFFREPEALFWVYVFPILLATGLGIAFRSRPAPRTDLGWAGWRPGGDALRAALAADSTVRLVVYTDSAAAALALRNGRVGALVLPQDSGVRYRYDSSRPEASLARLRADRILQRAAGRRDPLPVGDEPVRQRGSRYIDFLLPGLLGLNLMSSGIWGTGYAIVDARRKKLLKRLAATPMSRADYFASFLLAQLLLLVLEVGTILVFGVLVFHVPVRGSLGLLALTSITGSLAFGALGLLAAARPRTIEGASGLMNLIMLPMWVLSGVFFSAERFPAVMQPFIHALPLTALVDALRSVMLEGSGLGAVAGQLGVLLLWLGVSFALTLRLFRWR